MLVHMFPYSFRAFALEGLVPTRGRDGHQASADAALMEAVNAVWRGHPTANNIMMINRVVRPKESSVCCDLLFGS